MGIGEPQEESDDEADEPTCPAAGTHRFVMRMRSAPRRTGMPTEPALHGPALIVGDNPLADAWQDWFESQDKIVHRVSGLTRLDETLDAIWHDSFTPHLILTTPHDDVATWSTTDVVAMKQRVANGMSVAYRVCQRWMQRAIDDDMMHQASLVTNVRGGGRFGFDGAAALGLHETSAETGGLAGLTKAMLIEAWMRGYRDTPMLIVDNPEDASPAEIVGGSLREWAVPSHDEEVSVRGSSRSTTRAIYRPLETSEIHHSSGDADGPNVPINQITPGGTWIVAGGGRGITAYVTLELAQRHGLKLHLLGMAPAPNIDPETRLRAAEDPLSLRRETYARVQADGGNAVKYWRQFEKAIEIDQTLQRCRNLGIEATYHSVHIDDPEAVAAVVDRIRASDGPIRGVIQGAGSGQDARFDRKRPEKVRQCLSAKIDGTASLAAATKHDPLDWFVGFGSISGRFGANGHTDYSAANDMMAKMIARLSLERPGTRCTTFHWHAWGDIGMATKPEAKLALDMIGMKFMPAAEGRSHFLNELEFGGDETEVLITDRRYVRKFYPHEAIHSRGSAKVAAGPMIHPSGEPIAKDELAQDPTRVITLDPVADKFLAQHTVGGRPTLPMVMALEMMIETAVADRRRRGLTTTIESVRNLTAQTALKFAGDDPMAVQMQIVDRDAKQSDVILVADLRRSDGRLVQSERKHFSTTVQFGQTPSATIHDVNWQRDDYVWTTTKYAPADAAVHHGDPLRCLRGHNIQSSGANACLRGIVVTPSPLELGGDSRPLGGWQICPAVTDAVLYASGTLVHHVTGSPSLPIRIGCFEPGRLPDPGEPLRVQVDYLGRVAKSNHQSRLAAVLIGQNDDLIVRLTDYVIGHLG